MDELHRGRRVTRRPLALVLVLAALLATACSDSDDDERAAPDGFQAYDGDGFTLATPEGWQRTTGDERLNPEVDVEFVPADDESDAPPQIFVSATRARPGQTVNAYVTFLFGIGQFGVPEAELEEREIEVPGAEEATLVEFSYLEDRIDDPVEVRQWAVVARAEGRFYALRMASPEARFDEDLFETVIDTFEVSS